MLPERVVAVVIHDKKFMLVTGEGPDYFLEPWRKEFEGKFRQARGRQMALEKPSYYG